MNRSPLFLVAIVTLVLSGCASHGVIENVPLTGTSEQSDYSIRSFQQKWRASENGLMLAFSGGGTRAAALSYGVLKALRDTTVVSGGHTGRLLDHVHSISSVSGGSFTAAYYGLHGDGIFDDFEQVFLRENVEGALIRRIFNPLRWFRSAGRTETAVEYYEKTVFKGATFADMRKRSGPLVVINASDLGHGVRFSFVQEYFNLICSDLSAFPVARAVAASSAVPVLFTPVVVENYPDCGSEVPEWLRDVRARAADNPDLALVAQGLETYFNRDQRRYIHFIDGGITDNLGLRALYDVIELIGGIREYAEKTGRQPPRRLVVISVNASTSPELEMDRSNRKPSLAETVDAVTHIQLQRYNEATNHLMWQTLTGWARALSTPKRPVTPYFIRLDFRQIQDPERRSFFNQTPTSFHLSDEQVDELIEAGAELLRNHPEFRRLLTDMENDRHQNLQASPVDVEAGPTQRPR